MGSRCCSTRRMSPTSAPRLSVLVRSRATAAAAARSPRIHPAERTCAPFSPLRAHARTRAPLATLARVALRVTAASRFLPPRFDALRGRRLPREARAPCRVPALAAEGLLPHPDLPPEHLEERRDLREHPEEGLEEGPRHWTRAAGAAARRALRRGEGLRVEMGGGRIGAQGILPPRTAFPSLAHPPPSPAPRPPHPLPPAPPLPQVVRCLMINPFPESALNEEAGKLFMEEYDE